VVVKFVRRDGIVCLNGVLEWLSGICAFNAVSIYRGGSDVVIRKI